MKLRRMVVCLSVLGSFPILFINCQKTFTTSDVGSLSGANGLASGAALKSAGPFVCSDPTANAVAYMQRLSKMQYVNTLTTLFGTTAVASAATNLANLQNDMAIEQPTQFSVNYVQQQIDTFLAISDQMAASFLSDTNQQMALGGSCLIAATLTNSCLQNFAKSFGAQVWRRPITSTELTTMTTIMSAGTSKTDQLTALFEYLLNSQNFLYRVELGVSGDGSASNPLQLSSYEVANRLSYLITDNMPDSTLFQLAASNQLTNLATVAQQVDRLLQTDLAKTKFGTFVQYWLYMNPSTVHGIQPFPTGPATFVGSIDPTGLQDEVIREAKEFAGYMAFEQNGSYRDLMTSNLSFARTAALASIYGHPVVTSSTPAVMANGRQGLLMRPIFLAAPTWQTRPIHRGARMRARVFCEDPTPPAINVTLQGPDITTTQMIQTHSTRERYDLKTAGAACVGCHSIINPYGDLFEGFDAFGRFRTVETDYNADGSVLATHPLSLAANLQTADDGTLSEATPAGFVSDLAAGTDGPACFSRHLFRFYELTFEAAENNCALASVFSSLTSSTGSILSALKQTFANPSFLMKRTN
ncbi:MAG: hypothetical protein C5B49_10150 [Bdellovibrio sp.]|nr:MAG: hypothetical protein C5B49_10150 [Bdellovibrio sp.]